MPVILATWEAEIGNIMVVGHQGDKKFGRPSCQSKKKKEKT
jgi:hypothetical protein